MIELVDFNGGNTGSVINCLNRLDIPFTMVSSQNPPTGKTPLLFPGVGAFGASMKQLQDSGLDRLICDAVKKGTPYLGICIGLQVLFQASEEAPGVKGLGLLNGHVVRFTADKVPQMGWNWITAQDKDWASGHVYFVNGFYPQPEDPSDTLYTADYHGTFVAGVQHQNITAFQFHPEKSGAFGESLISRWYQRVQ